MDFLDGVNRLLHRHSGPVLDKQSCRAVHRLPDWCSKGTTLQYISRTTGDAHLVRVEKVEERQQAVMIRFEQDLRTWKRVPFAEVKMFGDGTLRPLWKKAAETPTVPQKPRDFEVHHEEEQEAAAQMALPVDPTVEGVDFPPSDSELCEAQVAPGLRCGVGLAARDVLTARLPMEPTATRADDSSQTPDGPAPGNEMTPPKPKAPLVADSDWSCLTALPIPKGPPTKLGPPADVEPPVQERRVSAAEASVMPPRAPMRSGATYVRTSNTKEPVLESVEEQAVMDPYLHPGPAANSRSPAPRATDASADAGGAQAALNARGRSRSRQRDRRHGQSRPGTSAARAAVELPPDALLLAPPRKEAQEGEQSNAVHVIVPNNELDLEAATGNVPKELQQETPLRPSTLLALRAWGLKLEDVALHEPHPGHPNESAHPSAGAEKEEARKAPDSCKVTTVDLTEEQEETPPTPAKDSESTGQPIAEASRSSKASCSARSSSSSSRRDNKRSSSGSTQQKPGTRARRRPMSPQGGDRRLRVRGRGSSRTRGKRRGGERARSRGRRDRRRLDRRRRRGSSPGEHRATRGGRRHGGRRR